MRSSYGMECILHLERNRVTGYWILADMRYSYGRECTVHLERNRVTGYWLTCGPVMGGCVLCIHVERNRVTG